MAPLYLDDDLDFLDKKISPKLSKLKFSALNLVCKFYVSGLGSDQKIEIVIENLPHFYTREGYVSVGVSATNMVLIQMVGVY